MKTRALLPVVALALLLGCERPPEEPAAPAPDQPEAITPEDANNVLDIGRGASMVARTGELSLEQSSLQAIDGIRSSFWASPPQSQSDTLVFSLAAPSRIERVGITPTANRTPPMRIRFERSSDGNTWTEVASLVVPPGTTPQYANVAPFEAEYLRITTLDGKTEFAMIHSIHALGTELRPPARREFGGCWMINGAPARIAQNGSHITGVIATTPPTWIEGASNGRVAMLAWAKGPTWGQALLSMPPDQQTLTGTTFFNSVFHEHQGPSWFGERCRDASAVDVPRDIPSRLLDAAGRWPIYGLIFDARNQLVEDASRTTLDAIAEITAKGRFRIVVHDVVTRDHAQNFQHAQTRAVSLRNALQKRGVDLTRVEVGAIRETDVWWVAAPLQHLLLTRVDLER